MITQVMLHNTIFEFPIDALGVRDTAKRYPQMGIKTVKNYEPFSRPIVTSFDYFSNIDNYDGNFNNIIGWYLRYHKEIEL